MKEYATAARTRRSVRKFKGGLTAEQLEELRGKLEELKPLCNGIAVEYEIVPREETSCKLNGEYCLLVFSEEKPLWLENVGYMLEQWDLFAASIGVGVCWFGMAKVDDKENMRFAIMLCFGIADVEMRTDTSQFVRRSVKDM